MSDRQVADALRSSAPLVLVEAPAGCGKTYQGAQYAKDLLAGLSSGRLLILTHTNAACDVFAQRTKGLGGRVDIRTIDSLIIQIAGAYHRALDLPADVTTWARQQGESGFNELAVKVARLLARSPAISASLAARYPYIICDEHQDSSEAQNDVIMSIHRAGALLRIFGDPMQAIYGGPKERKAAARRWEALQAAAQLRVALSTPHRWKEAPELGEWILEARSALKAGKAIDLRRELPSGLTLIRADNTAVRHGQYTLPRSERQPIDTFVQNAQGLFVLTPTNDLARGLNAFFGRRLPIWEGHTRDALWRLAQACREHKGDPDAIAAAFIVFVQTVATGFDSKYADVLRREVAERCCSRRSQKPAKIQELARLIVDCPDHRGVARALERLKTFVLTDTSFADIKLDLRREYGEASRLARYEDAEKGLAELNLLRSLSRTVPPTKMISTVHKAKGLETESVLLVPCDRGNFANTEGKRRLLYVAISRATKSLALVLPRHSPSPLFIV